MCFISINTVIFLIDGNFFPISISMVYRALSLLSSRINSSGSYAAIWRQSSEPIEPPAPVTTIRQPLTKWRTGFESRPTGSRSRRSSMARSRMCLILGPPLPPFLRLGSVLMGTLNGARTFTNLRIATGCALGTARRTSSGLSLSMILGRSSPMPKTGTP